MKLSHDMPLVSAYTFFLTVDSSDPLFEKQRENMNSESGEPQFTNFTNAFSGTLDYISYTANRFMVKGLLELLALEYVGNTALPSPEWSSDHIALVADFLIRPSPHGGEEANCPLTDRLL
ncbi:hypothetical protein IFM89_004418 [Coptis chinensis]|uniref:Endonuclease/exonuclease/phosphatase domain-containing protein n=1 Tax=Coptis chinensis TaxID=261450 RepID=A0A835M4P1_9MAGN|nr:hypothetical protein IFM89_004418 [Coptis chinensis]